MGTLSKRQRRWTGRSFRHRWHRRCGKVGAALLGGGLTGGALVAGASTVHLTTPRRDCGLTQLADCGGSETLVPTLLVTSGDVEVAEVGDTIPFAKEPERKNRLLDRVHGEEIEGLADRLVNASQDGHESFQAIFGNPPDSEQVAAALMVAAFLASERGTSAERVIEFALQSVSAEMVMATILENRKLQELTILKGREAIEPSARWRRAVPDGELSISAYTYGVRLLAAHPAFEGLGDQIVKTHQAPLPTDPMEALALGQLDPRHEIDGGFFRCVPTTLYSTEFAAGPDRAHEVTRRTQELYATIDQFYRFADQQVAASSPRNYPAFAANWLLKSLERFGLDHEAAAERYHLGDNPSREEQAVAIVNLYSAWIVENFPAEARVKLLAAAVIADGRVPRDEVATHRLDEAEKDLRGRSLTLDAIHNLTANGHFVVAPTEDDQDPGDRSGSSFHGGDFTSIIASHLLDRRIHHHAPNVEMEAELDVYDAEQIKGWFERLGTGGSVLLTGTEPRIRGHMMALHYLSDGTDTRVVFYNPQESDGPYELYRLVDGRLVEGADHARGRDEIRRFAWKEGGDTLYVSGFMKADERPGPTAQ